MKPLTKLAMSCAMAWGAFLGTPRALGQGPLVTATGPEIEMHGGFEYIGQQVPGQAQTRVPMYGVSSGLTAGLSRHLGIRLDLGYARSGAVFSSGHHSDILSYMGGPVFYPVRTARLVPYAELLVGAARVTGATPNTTGGYNRGYANELAWAGGGGIEVRTRPEFALRVGADYFHTSFFDPSAAIAGQGNIRAMMSFAYFFGGRRR